MDRLRHAVRIEILTEVSFFGSEVADLLQFVDETHSLHKACERMEMAYSKGWKIVKFAEQKLEFPLLESKAGGIYGGGSELTSEGRNFIECFVKYRSEIERVGDRLFIKHFEAYL